MPNPHLKRFRPNGFSIIELLIVVLVFGILVAISGISFIRYQKSIEADDVGSRLAQKIREVRNQAMADRATYQIALIRDSSATSDAYAVGRYPNSANFPAQLFRLPEGWRFTLPNGTPSSPATILRLPEAVYAIPPSSPLTLVDDPRVNLSGRATSFLTFKGDGTVVQANLSDPTSNFNNTPINRTIFLRFENDNAVTRAEKGRALTIFGLTGQTQLWKFQTTGFWVSGRQQVNN
jgi:prepilin-type N-terminal cleavage/methylation domain-containing protein